RGQAYAWPRLEGPFEAVVRPVALARLTDDQEWQSRAKRGRSRERDGAQFGPREQRRVRLDLGHLRGDPLRQRREQLRPRLEAVLVQVVARPAARAQHEVALDVGVLANRRKKLGVVHRRGYEPAAPTASWATGRSRP